MTSVIFDPDARTEFLASVKYYEDCQHGLGNRFRLAILAMKSNKSMLWA